jgi:hypothetical protein
MKSSIKLTEADVQNCTWTFSHFDGPYRVSIGHGHHPATGVPIEVQRREFMAEDTLLTLNAEERNARDAKPWSAGGGSEKGGNVPMVRVGRIPLNLLFANGISDKMREGDKDHLKWWLNRDENQPFRTRSGKL